MYPREPLAGSAESGSSLTHTYHVRAPLAMSSSSPPPPEVPPASYASSSGRGPWPLPPTGSTNADAASGPEAKRFRYREPKRWGESRDNAVVTGDQDWLNPGGGGTAVDRSTDDVPMQSEPPIKFCTRCNQEGHCAGEGCHALAPDAIPVTPMRPKAAAERPEAGGSKPISRARWSTSAPRTEWPDKPDKTEAAAGAATGSASSAGGHRGALPAERDDPMPSLIPLPTVMNAEPVSMWPAPEGYWKEEVIPGGPPPSGVWPPDFGPPDFPRESISDDDVDVIRAAWKAVREADEADLHLHRFEDAAPAAAAAAPAATAEAPAATV